MADELVRVLRETSKSGTVWLTILFSFACILASFKRWNFSKVFSPIVGENTRCSEKHYKLVLETFPSPSLKYKHQKFWVLIQRDSFEVHSANVMQLMVCLYCITSSLLGFQNQSSWSRLILGTSICIYPASQVCLAAHVEICAAWLEHYQYPN